MMGRYPILFRIWKVGTDKAEDIQFLTGQRWQMYKYNPIKTRIFSKSIEESLRKETSHRE